MVRSLGEIRDEFKNLTNLGGETVNSLLEAKRWFIRRIIVRNSSSIYVDYICSRCVKSYTKCTFFYLLQFIQIFLCTTMHCMLRMQYVIILLNRLFVANYSSLETIPLVPGNKTVFYAPHVRPKAVFIQNMIFLVLARGSMRLASPCPQNIL